MGHWFGAFAQAGEDVPDEVQALEIKSETTLCSADFYIAKEQGKDVDEKTDKERKKTRHGGRCFVDFDRKAQGGCFSVAVEDYQRRSSCLSSRKNRGARRGYIDGE